MMVLSSGRKTTLSKAIMAAPIGGRQTTGAFVRQRIASAAIAWQTDLGLVAQLEQLVDSISSLQALSDADIFLKISPTFILYIVYIYTNITKYKYRYK